MIDFKELIKYIPDACSISRMTGVDRNYLLAHLRWYGVRSTNFSFSHGLELSPKLFMFFKAISVILSPYKNRASKLCLDVGDDSKIYYTILSLCRIKGFKK